MASQLIFFMLSEDQVKHIAKLARVALSDEEVERFSKQLSDVLKYVEILNEVDTKKVSETSQVTGLKNIMRVDEVEKSKCPKEDLLACSELPVDSDQVRVMHAIK